MIVVYRWCVGFLFVLSVVLVGVLSVVWERAERYGLNQAVLLDSVQQYRVRDSLGAVSVGILKLEVGELKHYRAQDAQLIKDLGVRLRRAQSISRTATQGEYNTVAIRTQQDTTATWQHKTMWIDYTVKYRADTVYSNLIVRDTLVQVLHRVPRFKFLGIRIGTKGVRQEIVSLNPNTRITAAEYLEIVR